jgi:hypothetical protein
LKVENTFGMRAGIQRRGGRIVWEIKDFRSIWQRNSRDYRSINVLRGGVALFQEEAEENETPWPVALVFMITFSASG